MKKLFLLFLALAVAFSFCKKSSSGTEEEEDVIVISVQVTLNGSQLNNARVVLKIERKYIVNDPLNSGPPTSSLSAEYDHEQFTGTNGKTTFTLRRMSINSTNSVFVKHVNIATASEGVLVDEDVDYEVMKGDTQDIIYDI
ncbi:hypothetical protein ACFL4T_09320 [candidate division KSB1 bacterium]